MRTNNFRGKSGSGKLNNKTEKRGFAPFFSLIVWVLIWHFAAWLIDNEIFLPTPLRVFSVLGGELLPSAGFWSSLLTSLLHIGAGFLAGALLGVLLAIFSAFYEPIKFLLWLPMKVLKSVPVASFVILSLLWFRAEYLSVFVPAAVVLPMIYIPTLTGLEQVDGKLQEMVTVFRVPVWKRWRYVYLPQILPYILSAASLAVGMAWKSGVAAEIIGLARNSIGNELYKAKLYLMIPELFAWTLVIVCLSVACEWFIGKIIALTGFGAGQLTGGKDGLR